MTARPTDDELRAMLEARAGAVSPGAARVALAGARAQIAGPSAGDGAGVAFTPRPVAAVHRRSRMPWGIAAVVAAAAVTVAVLGSRVQEPDRPTASSPVAGASQGPTSSDRSILVGDITVDELRTRLKAGELDGKTVVIPGRLYQEYGRCRAVTDCTWLRIDGVSNVDIDRGGRSVDEVQSDIDRFGTSAPIVLRGVSRDLELVGWLVDGADAPISAEALTLVRNEIPGGLLSVTGWLHPGGMAAQLTSASESGRGKGVAVFPDPAVRPEPGAAPSFGTYLVRPAAALRLGTPSRWDLVARFDPATTVRVQQPRTQLAGPTIPAADLMAALGDGSLDGQVFAIDGELKDVAWECPLDARPCHRFYVDGLPGVAVTWDGGLLGSDGAPDAPVSVMSGRLLVTPRHGYLELLGRLDGGLDRPDLLDELPSTDPAPVLDPLTLRSVDGWLVVDGIIYCALQRPGAGTACPPTRSLLTPSEPTSSGVLTSPQNVPVTLRRGTPGLEPLPIRQEGPFLIRYGVVGSTCDGIPNGDASCLSGPRFGWILVAAYDAASVRVVTFP